MQGLQKVFVWKYKRNVRTLPNNNRNFKILIYGCRQNAADSRAERNVGAVQKRSWI